MLFDLQLLLLNAVVDKLWIVAGTVIHTMSLLLMRVVEGCVCKTLLNGDVVAAVL